MKSKKITKTWVAFALVCLTAFNTVSSHASFLAESNTSLYDKQTADIVEDVYKKAILSFGIFSATYVDNGSQFVSKQLIRALAQLGIRHLRAKPYACQSKGYVKTSVM